MVVKLTIKYVDIGDFGLYKCIAKNSLGETDGTIKLYRKFIIILLLKMITKNSIRNETFKLIKFHFFSLIL